MFPLKMGLQFVPLLLLGDFLDTVHSIWVFPIPSCMHLMSPWRQRSSLVSMFILVIYSLSIMLLLELMGPIYHYLSMGTFLGHRTHKFLPEGSESSSSRPFSMGLFSNPIITHPSKNN